MKSQAKQQNRTGGETVSKSPRSEPKRRGGRITKARREEIVRKSAALFLERGYDSVSIDEIVAEIGGSKATVYARFGGKAGLFIMAIEQYCAAIEGSMSMELDPSDSLEDQLVQLAETFLTLILDEKTLKLHRLIVSLGDSFPKVSETFYKAGPLAAYHVVAEWIRRQQKAGRLGSGDPELLSSLFLDMLTGRHQLGYLTGQAPADQDSIKKLARTAAKLFLNGAQASS